MAVFLLLMRFFLPALDLISYFFISFLGFSPCTPTTYFFSSFFDLNP
jgi:hypothetical protein